MASIPKKVGDRLAKQVARFQRIIRDAKDRDVNESDTVTIITDMLSDVFGFDKYSEVTSEQAIRGTYCDLAVKLDGKIQYLMEVKAVGLTLKENHLRQAVNYGANQGIPWVVLTNGVCWEIYKILFEKPVGFEHVCSIDFLALSPRKADHQQHLFILCREGLAKAAIEDFHEHVQIVNRFVLGALIQTDPVMSLLRRELKRLAPGAKVEMAEVRDLLPDVLKRDVLEGDLADQAKARVSRASGKLLRKARPALGKNSTAKAPGALPGTD